jgi:hypothetical protein
MIVHMLTNAARQGCRVATLDGKTNSDITTAVGNTMTPLGISTDTITVQVNDAAANASTAKPGDEITVIVSVPISTVSWVPVAKYLSGTFSGQYTLTRE